MIHFRFSLLCLFALAFSTLAIAQSPIRPVFKTMPYDSASVPREHVLDFQHLRLEASFNPQAGQILGKVTHTFTTIRSKVDSVFLDAPGIEIKEVLFQKKSIGFRQSAEGVTILFPKSMYYGQMDSVSITYEAQPRAGLYFIGWNDASNRSRKQIWSQGQGIDNRNWIPMYDEMNDKVSSEMIITMPEPYKVLSNGKFIGVSKNGTNATWHYEMSHPHAPYLIMLGIGDYEIETRTTNSGLKTNLWYYPDWKNRVNDTYAYSTEMIDFFEKEIGVAFPWENYSQIPVQDFMYGAMENTTATVFGDFFFVDKRELLDRNYVGVNAHELAHQWFGDFVTARSKSHHWLQESFATHYNTLYEGIVFGEQHRQQAFLNAQNASLRASMKDLHPLASSEAGSTRWYPKGASVLFMLRYVIGDGAFRVGVQHYLEQNAYGNVDSDDLLDAFQEACGYSLQWFWDEWVYRGGEPVWKVSTAHTSGKTVFSLEQRQIDEPAVSIFQMPVILEVHFTDGTSQRDSVFVSREQQDFTMTYPEGKKPLYSLFDPGNRILKYMEFDKQWEELKAQAKFAHEMPDRMDAVLQMEKIDIEMKRKFLHDLLNSNEWYTIKEVAMDQIRFDKKSEKLISSLIGNKDVHVRKAVVFSYDTLPNWLIPGAEKLLLDSSYSIQEAILRKLAISNKAKINQYLDATSKEQGNNSHNTRIAWLGIAIENGRREFIPELVDFFSAGFEFGTRRNASSELLRLKIVTEDAIANAFNAAINTNGRLASAGRGYLLRSMKSDAQIKDQIIAYLELQKTNAEEWKLEIIQKLINQE